MKLTVNKDLCIGCGACVSICPKVFAMDDDGFAYTKSTELIESEKENAIEALESCPTDAILNEKED